MKKFIDWFTDLSDNLQWCLFIFGIPATLGIIPGVALTVTGQSDKFPHGSVILAFLMCWGISAAFIFGLLSIIVAIGGFIAWDKL